MLYFHRSRGRGNAGAMPFLSGTPAFCASKLTPYIEWVEQHSRGSGIQHNFGFGINNCVIAQIQARTEVLGRVCTVCD